MRLPGLTFKIKLALSYLFVILLSFGLIAFFLDRNLEEHSLREIKASLLHQGYLVEHQIDREALRNEETAYLEGLVKRLGDRIKARLTVVNTRGRVLADSERSEVQVSEMENHADRPEIKAALRGERGESIRYSATLKIDMLYVALPIEENGAIVGVLRIALPLENVKETLGTVRRGIILSVCFALGLAFVLGSLLTAGFIKPVNRIIHVSRKFAEGDFSRRIYLDSGDEIGELAATLNKMAQDIEDKIKETEIQNQHLQAVFQSMVEGIIVADRDGRIISLNSAAEKIFNITREDAEGRLFLEAVRNSDLAGIMQTVLERGEFLSREISIVWPLQKVFQINASPVFVKGSASACLAVIHDITEIRRLETMRRDFVANVSHELKTPLTAIKGFVETLLEGALEDKEHSRHFLQIIQDHTARLDSLVNDLLDLSYLESGAASLQRSPVNLRALIDEAFLAFGAKLKKKAIKAENLVDAGFSINADKDKLAQVLTNLIDNAIKFNREHGSLKIYHEDLGGKVKVVVEDSGLGIPAKDLPRIFERFYRVDRARSRELGGTGLGLSIVKHIVELHAGSVGVESVEGSGSKFWFTLPR